MELPASEIEFWREYYEIFDFPEERQDFQFAKLLEMLNTMAQHKYFKKAMSWRDFMPTYLGKVEKTKAEKLRDAKAFRAHYKQIQEMKNGY
jgi:hypothetical protein